MFAWLTIIANGQEICTNAVDDDGNGAIDCADPGCAFEPWAAPSDLVPRLAYGHAVAVDDIDGDGDDDVYESHTYDVNLFVGSGTGGFLAQRVGFTGYGTGPLATTDLDGDGRRDVLVGTIGVYYGETTHIWGFQQNAAGAFDRFDLFAVDGFDIRDIAVGDIDADGLPDVLFATWDGMGWLPGAGGFALGAPRPIPASGYETELVDLDGDGDLDVLANDYRDAFWVPNLTNGEFGGPIRLSSSPDIHDAVSGDFDGDGDRDVAIGSWASPNVAWVENLGGGSFGPETLLTAVPTSDVASFDFDGDGLDDVVTIDGSGVSGLRSLGGGVSAPSLPFQKVQCDIDFVTPHGGHMLQLADIDGGPLDLLCSVRGFGFDAALVWHPGLDCPAQDADADGLSNIDERTVTTTDPFLADTDGDGVDDGQEITDGSDPLVADRTPTGPTDTGTEAVDTGGTTDTASPSVPETPSAEPLAEVPADGGCGCGHGPAPGAQVALFGLVLGLRLPRARPSVAAEQVGAPPAVGPRG